MEKEEYSNAVEKSKKHWEMDVSDSIFPKAKEKNQLDNFIAKEGEKWPRSYVKINECDY